MNSENTFIIAIASLVITLVSVTTGFILQLDKKKNREIERENRKLKKRLLETLEAIEGYQHIEASLADRKSIPTEQYRGKIRKSERADKFQFLTPSKLKDYKKDLL